MSENVLNNQITGLQILTINRIIALRSLYLHPFCNPLRAFHYRCQTISNIRQILAAHAPITTNKMLFFHVVLMFAPVLTVCFLPLPWLRSTIPVAPTCRISSFIPNSKSVRGLLGNLAFFFFYTVA